LRLYMCAVCCVLCVCACVCVRVFAFVCGPPQGKIGGDAGLSPKGIVYSQKLAEFMNAHYPEGTELSVWTRCDPDRLAPRSSRPPLTACAYAADAASRARRATFLPPGKQASGGSAWCSPLLPCRPTRWGAFPPPMTGWVVCAWCAALPPSVSRGPGWVFPSKLRACPPPHYVVRWGVLASRRHWCTYDGVCACVCLGVVAVACCVRSAA
jgi:hypothetical protein